MEMEWAVAAAASGEGLSDGPGQLARTAGGGGNQQLPSRPASLSPLVSPQRRLFNWSELSFGRRQRALWLLSAPLPSASLTG